MTEKQRPALRVIQGGQPPTTLTPAMINEIGRFLDVSRKLAYLCEGNNLYETFETFTKKKRGENAWEGNIIPLITEAGAIEQDIRTAESLYLKYFDFLQHDPRYVHQWMGEVHLGYLSMGDTEEIAEAKTRKETNSIFRLYGAEFTQLDEDAKNAEIAPSGKNARKFPQELMKLSQLTHHLTRDALTLLIERHHDRAPLEERMIYSPGLLEALSVLKPRAIPEKIVGALPDTTAIAAIKAYRHGVTDVEKKLAENGIAVQIENKALEKDELIGHEKAKVHTKNIDTYDMLDSLDSTSNALNMLTVHFEYIPATHRLINGESVALAKVERRANGTLLEPYNVLTDIEKIYTPQLLSHAERFNNTNTEYDFVRERPQKLTLQISQHSPLAITLQQISEKQMLDKSIGLSNLLKSVSIHPKKKVGQPTHRGMATTAAVDIAAGAKQP